MEQFFHHFIQLTSRTMYLLHKFAVHFVLYTIGQANTKALRPTVFSLISMFQIVTLMSRVIVAKMDIVHLKVIYKA